MKTKGLRIYNFGEEGNVWQILALNAARPRIYCMANPKVKCRKGVYGRSSTCPEGIVWQIQQLNAASPEGNVWQIPNIECTKS